MSQLVNIYCDESGHLEKDQVGVMVIGAVWCPENKTEEIAENLRNLKVAHELPSSFEFKWGKISPAKQKFYEALIEYFFAEKNLHFRAVVIPDKSILKHKAFHQTHDDFYYKMFFTLLTHLVNPEKKYRIYLDYKDTRGEEKIQKLHEVLSNDQYDFDREIIERIQTVRSHEVQQIQLTDLLIGAISYANRGLTTSSAKVRIVEKVRELSTLSLLQTTLLKEEKLNILIWRPG